jgi:hypothetical protein
MDCCGAPVVCLKTWQVNVGRQRFGGVPGAVLGQLLLLVGSMSLVDKGQVYDLGIQRGFMHCTIVGCWKRCHCMGAATFVWRPVWSQPGCGLVVCARRKLHTVVWRVTVYTAVCLKYAGSLCKLQGLYLSSWCCCAATQLPLSWHAVCLDPTLAFIRPVPQYCTVTGAPARFHVSHMA